MTSGGAKSYQEIEDEIKRVNTEMLQANALIADASVPDDYLDLKYMELANQVAELRKEQATGTNREENEKRLQAMREAMCAIKIDCLLTAIPNTYAIVRAVMLRFMRDRDNMHRAYCVWNIRHCYRAKSANAAMRIKVLHSTIYQCAFANLHLARQKNLHTFLLYPPAR